MLSYSVLSMNKELSTAEKRYVEIRINLPKQKPVIVKPNNVSRNLKQKDISLPNQKKIKKGSSLENSTFNKQF